MLRAPCLVALLASVAGASYEPHIALAAAAAYHHTPAKVAILLFAAAFALELNLTTNHKPSTPNSQQLLVLYTTQLRAYILSDSPLLF